MDRDEKEKWGYLCSSRCGLGWTVLLIPRGHVDLEQPDSRGVTETQLPSVLTRGMLLSGEGGRGFWDLLLGAPKESDCPVTMKAVGKLPGPRVLQSTPK